MNEASPPHAVNQKIFTMGFPMETVSVYLLCCGLAEAGTPLTVKRLMEVWNGTEDQLRDGLKALERRGILHADVSGGNGDAGFRMTAHKNWKCH